MQASDERFWSQVDRSGGPNSCWIWGAGKNGIGYGAYRDVTGAQHLAHRYAWTITHGPIPDGLRVCHNCPGGDQPACVNPNHLFLGSQADNIRDMVNKGRGLVGEKNGAAKVTVDEVRAIRGAAQQGETQRSIARRFSVSEASISMIVARKTWAHVPEEGDAHSRANC